MVPHLKRDRRISVEDATSIPNKGMGDLALEALYGGTLDRVPSWPPNRRDQHSSAPGAAPPPALIPGYMEAGAGQST